MKNYSRLRIIKNLLILNFAFLITFNGYGALSVLQRSTNTGQEIEIASQPIIYVFFCVSAFLFPKYIIQRFGCKRCLVICMICYIPYIASHFYPHWILIVPSAILCGLPASVLWCSQSTYLNEMAALFSKCPVSSIASPETSNKYIRDKKHSRERAPSKPSCGSRNAKLEKSEEKLPFVKLANVDLNSDENVKDKVEFQASDIESTTARFFGFSGMVFVSNHIWSSLVSYYILQKHDGPKNVTISTICTCGPYFCNTVSECFENNMKEPSIATRFVLISICMSFVIFSAFPVCLFLDPVKPGSKNITFSFEFLLATYKLIKTKKQQLLIPLTFYMGMLQAFFSEEFTKSYIGCSWGTYHFGLVGICYGSTSALSSAIAGWFVKSLGRITIFLIAEVINVVSMVFLLSWHPEASNPSLFFLGAGLWGIAVGAFWSQLRAYYGVIFRGEEEVGFAGYNFWLSLGICVTFAYSNYVCTFIKIYILLTLSVIGVFCYVISEYVCFSKK